MTGRLAYAWLGERASRSPRLVDLERDLRRARISVRADAYLAQAWLTMALGMVACTVFFGIGGFAAVALGMPRAAAFAAPLLGIGIGAAFGWATLATPASKAKKRAKNLEEHLPYAANYAAAMSSAGIVPQEMFASLGRQDVYGEVATEAAAIDRDIRLHGLDLITALRRGIHRSPSPTFSEFLQGAVTSIGSGGDLTAYFRQKADRYQWENRVEQKSFIETMGLMAESYVTVAVAGPLFLIVMLAIIVLMGSGQFSQLQLVIYMLLPVINAGFLFGLKAMMPEV
ncbi:MAG: type II secretion system F family protein [Thermoplasmatota archaeon]